MLKIGLIGCGSMGTAHANSYRAMSDLVQVVAVADVREELGQEKATMFGATLYKDGAALIAEADVDAVDICLPTFLHTEHAVLAMKKGLDVFMEKPVCLNEEEAQLLLKTQKETGKQVQIGQVLRFDAPFVFLKKVVQDGRYGKLVSAVFERLSAYPTWGHNQWFQDDKKSGSCALDLHIHDIDFIRYIMEREPDSFHSECVRGKDGILQHIFTHYRFGDSFISAEGGWHYAADYPFDANYRVKFEKATLVMRDGKVMIYTEGGGMEEAKLEKPEFKNEDMGFNISDISGYYSELRYFVEHISAGEPIQEATLPEAINSVRLAWKEIEACGGSRI